MFSMNLRNAVARFPGGGRSGHPRSFSSIPNTVPKDLRGIFIHLMRNYGHLLPWIYGGYAGYCGYASYDAVKTRKESDLRKSRNNSEELELAKIQLNHEELEM